MRGVSRHTGQLIEGLDHLAERITDVLTTPIGSRVMRHDYGSTLHRLIDAPVNAGTPLLVYAATASALMRWIADFRLTRVQLTRNEAAGSFALHLDGYRTDLPALPGSTRISIPLRASAAGLITA